MKQHTFPQRIGKLIEDHIISKESLTPNKRQQTKGYFDAYDATNIYEIKAAKDNNYFRIMQKNHKLLCNASGTYIFVNYSLKNRDEALKVITDVIIENIYRLDANNLMLRARLKVEDQRKQNLFYKVKF